VSTLDADVFSYVSIRLLYAWFQVQLPAYIENVKEKLAENLHELWAMSKIENGWIWGDVCIAIILSHFVF